MHIQESTASPLLLHMNWKELGNAANDGICTEKHNGKLLVMHALQMLVWDLVVYRAYTF